MNLEDRIKIAEWCGWKNSSKLRQHGYADFNVPNDGGCNSEVLFKPASHFEALRQVLREKGYFFRHDSCYFPSTGIEVKEHILVEKHLSFRIVREVINGDEHTAWLTAVLELIKKESK